MGDVDRDVYGSLEETQARIRESIGSMLREKLLRKAGDKRYPVLELTKSGRRALARLEATSPPARLAAQAPKLKQVRQESHARPHDSEVVEGAAEALDGMIDDLLESEADKAKSTLPSLRLYHPREVANRLVSRFDASESDRVRARAVWGAGELCGQHAVDFLIRCATCDDPDIRRFAASGLGKAVRSMRGESKRIASCVDRARQALQTLAKDPADKVRQYAAVSLSQLPIDKAETER